MQFPLFHAPYVGNGMVIGLNAIVHVIISHGIAIGLIAMIALAEYFGFKKGSEEWENFSRELLKIAVIITTGIGAATGVGIWFTTSVLNPYGIGSLLRVFFWPWFFEWVIFTLEAIVILIYYYTWDKWTIYRKKYHVYLGFIYVLLGSASAFFITGIMAFMLTSDGWPWDKSFWSAFFNPGFLPQSLLRLSGSFALGSLFFLSFLLFKRSEHQFRREALSFYGKIFLISLIFTSLCSWWYFSVVPSSFKTHMVFSVLTSHFSQKPEIFRFANGIGMALLLLFSLFAIKGSTVFSRILILPAILISIAFVSEFERIREFIRGPYIMPGYMYSNQVLLEENYFLKKEGMLENAYWYYSTVNIPNEINKGAFLFAQNCTSCHTIDGINDIKDRIRGRTEDGIFVILGHTHEMVPFMPPFSGTDVERRTVAHLLYQLSQGTAGLKHPSRCTPLGQ